MVWLMRPQEIADEDGKGTGRWRMTATSEDGGGGPWGMCDCEDGHETSDAARDCPKAREKLTMY
jgi:hypothetical protein